MRLFIFFFKYWTVSYLQFGYFFVRYAYCTWIDFQTRVILDTLHRGEPTFVGKKIIATTSSTKKEWLAILDYMQYTWATDVIIISIFLQKKYYTYKIDLHWSNHDYKWNRIRIMILHLSLRKYSPIFVLVKLMIDVKKYSLHSRFTFSLEQIRSSPKWDLAYKPFL